jgi:hypothetical protein
MDGKGITRNIMKDPLDDRPDAYALLDCSENCTRAVAQRNYTMQLVRRAVPQRDLQAAREVLVRANQRLLYDIYRYNFPEEVAGTDTLEPSNFDLEIDLPLPDAEFDPEWVDLAALAAQIELRWTSPNPPDVEPLLEAGEPIVPILPIEFDS